MKLILGMNMTGMVMHSGATINRTAIGGLRGKRGL